MNTPSPRLTTAIVGVVLWLVSSAGVIASIYWLRQLSVFALAAMDIEMPVIQALANFEVVILGVIATGYLIGTTEYHAKHFMCSGALKLTYWTIGVVGIVAIVHYGVIGLQ